MSCLSTPPISNREFLHQLITDLSGPTGVSEITTNLVNYSRIFVPDCLYRYRECGKPHSFSDIENGCLTLTSPSEFDDVDDTTIHDIGAMERMAATIIEEKDLSFEMLRNYISVFESAMGDQASELLSYAEHTRNMSRSERKQAIENLTKQIKAHVDVSQANEALRRQQRVACLSENDNSEYMWKHYGGNGTGYLIEYESRNLFGIDLLNKKLPLILPVIYTDSLPDTFLLPVALAVETSLRDTIGEKFVGGLLAINLVKCIFYKRIAPYIAEEEWRLMLPPHESERTDVRIFRPAKPSRVIAGDNMSHQDRQKLIECAKLYDIAVDERAYR